MRDDLTSLVQDIKVLLEQTGSIIDKFEDTPSQKSKAYHELSVYQDPEQVKAVFSLGDLLIQGASDHMFAFTKMLTEPLVTIAPWTIVRGILETSSLAAWLYDPNLDANERVSRCFAFRYEGLVQQQKLSRTSDIVEPSEIDKRIDEVDRHAMSLGYLPVINKKGERIGIGQIMPSVTELIKITMDKEIEFRIFSAMVHGHSWAYHQLSFKKGFKSQDSVFLEKDLPPIAFCTLFDTALEAFYLPIRYKFQLYGWKIESVEIIYKSTHEKLESFFLKYVKF